MTRQNKVLIIVPAYNEAQSIGAVIDSIRTNAPWADIVVVNDGSRDATAQIAEARGAFVLNLPYNLGIGGAVQTGYKFAAEMGYDIAVQVDSDGQHPASEIGRLVRALDEHQVDVVIGSRYLENRGYKTPLTRLLGIKLVGRVVSLLIGQRVTDTSSGFRAANRRVIHLFARLYPRDYPEPESLVLLHHHEFNIKEIPIPMNQRIGGRSSISFVTGIYYVIKVLLATVMDVFKAKL